MKGKHGRALFNALSRNAAFCRCAVDSLWHALYARLLESAGVRQADTLELLHHRHDLRQQLMSTLATLLIGGWIGLTPTITVAQVFDVIGANVQKRANGVLALMGLALTPDVTTGTLSINEAQTDDPDFSQVSGGGGFTVSQGFPLYLEGTLGYSQYDPVFIATNGQERRRLPVKWNSVVGTGGIGWDFPLTDELKLRPIFNFSLGHVESDASLAGRVITGQTGLTLAFLENGRLNAYGLGGSLMLDYERYRPENEIDVELRYTHIYLQSFASSRAVQGNADAQSLNLWARWRAPTGLSALDRPLRYVLEYAHTTFLGDLDGVLGFNHLNSLGVGLELDSSKYPIVITRTRLVVRYLIGKNVSGGSLGLAVTF
jgi:hypothetical protein